MEVTNISNKDVALWRLIGTPYPIVSHGRAKDLLRAAVNSMIDKIRVKPHL